jgi:hypothetical protein
MNPFLMWLRSHPAERLALGIFVLVVLGIGWQVLAHRGQASTGQAGPSPTASAPAGTVPGTSPAPTTGSTPSSDDLAAASDVAGQFLVALNTYRYDDGIYTLDQRVRPFVTDNLYYANGFDKPSVPGFGKRRDLHEVDTPTVTKLTSEGYAANGQIGFLARVNIEQKTDQGTTKVSSAFELFVVRQTNGWRVDSFTPGATATEGP